MKRPVEELTSYGVGFAVIQTVFEGTEQNTFVRLRENQKKYELEISFGHDIVAGSRPTIMGDYQTGGTPWFIVIDSDGRVVFSDFHIDVEKLITSIQQNT